MTDKEEHELRTKDYFEEHKLDKEDLKGIELNYEERCPHILRRQAGDESYDICTIKGKSCLIEHGLYECETWNEIKEEWKHDN